MNWKVMLFLNLIVCLRFYSIFSGCPRNFLVIIAHIIAERPAFVFVNDDDYAGSVACNKSLASYV